MTHTRYLQIPRRISNSSEQKIYLSINTINSSNFGLYLQMIIYTMTFTCQSFNFLNWFIDKQYIFVRKFWLYT